MPETAITIDRDQRDGLYELVRNHLGSIEDFWIALERRKDFDAAERLGEQLAQDFRLLRDIGWSEHDVRKSYLLTMRANELADLLRRLRDEATHVLIESGTEAQASREDAIVNQRFRSGYETCEKVLPDLVR
jgi:hypothetical protein